MRDNYREKLSARASKRAAPPIGDWSLLRAEEGYEWDFMAIEKVMMMLMIPK